MKLGPVAVLAASGLVAAAFAGVFQPPGAHSASGTDATAGGITASGTGTVTLIPDRAEFSFGTVSQAKTAAAALAASSQAVSRLIDALTNAGVAKSDIQTSEVSLSPRTNDTGDEIVGYTASNTVTATIRKLANAGGVVDAAVGAGANQVSGPNLLVSDQEAAYHDALKAAFAEARAKADTLAKASGVTLGGVTAISEGAAMPIPVPLAAGARDSSTPIEPGTQNVQATVSVTFAIG